MITKLYNIIQKKICRSKQHGITIVSLMIGMTLSTFLITAVLQIFITTKKNYKLSQNIIEMNDAMRYTIDRMTNIISYTGHRIPTSPTGQLPSYIDAYGTFCTTKYGCGPGLYLLAYTEGTLPDGQRDMPIVITQGSGEDNIKDCLGNTVAANTISRVQFSVEEIPTRTGLSLKCDQLNDMGVATASTYIISDLVEGLWVQYGHDDNNDGNINRYYSSVGGGTIRRSIRVAIMLHSREEVFAQAQTQTFSVWGQTITKTGKQIYKLHIFTVHLNQLPVPM